MSNDEVAAPPNKRYVQADVRVPRSDLRAFGGPSSLPAEDPRTKTALRPAADKQGPHSISPFRSRLYRPRKRRWRWDLIDPTITLRGGAGWRAVSGWVSRATFWNLCGPDVPDQMGEASDVPHDGPKPGEMIHTEERQQAMRRASVTRRPDPYRTASASRGGKRFVQGPSPTFCRSTARKPRVVVMPAEAASVSGRRHVGDAQPRNVSNVRRITFFLWNTFN